MECDVVSNRTSEVSGKHQLHEVDSLPNLTIPSMADLFPIVRLIEISIFYFYAAATVFLRFLFAGTVLQLIAASRRRQVLAMILAEQDHGDVTCRYRM